MRFVESLYVDDLFTEDTKNSFDEPISSVRLLPNVEYGPFYRIDSGGLAEEKFEKTKIDPNKILTPDIKHLVRTRTERLRKFCDICNKKIKIGVNKELAEAFLIQHQEAIEMDPRFSLLPSFQLFFPEGLCQRRNIRQCVEKVWRKVSPSRWYGIDKPVNFEDGDKKYNLQHLHKSYYTDKPLFLFEFHYKSNKYCGAELFFGKTKGGTAIQYKFNNAAAKCISDLKCLSDFSQKK